MSGVHFFRLDKQHATHKKGAKMAKRRKDLINDADLANNITPRRDGEELACVVQRKRITNKSY